MPPKLLYDLERIDPDNVIYGIEEIRKYNRQRYEMEQVDGILHLDLDEGIVVGVRNVRMDEFWIRGHIPGRPLLPGVLMCECAAQLCSFLYGMKMGSERFLGFGGLEGVRFRGIVVPGDQMIMLGKALEIRSRRAIFATQELVAGRLVFEGTVIGMPF